MRGHTRTGLRIGAYVASGALALSGAVLAVTPAQAVATTRSPANRQRTGWPGSSPAACSTTASTTSTTGALTIDPALALDAVGGHGCDRSREIAARSDQTHVDGYIAAPSRRRDTYAGSTRQARASSPSRGRNADDASVGATWSRSSRTRAADAARSPVASRTRVTRLGDARHARPGVRSSRTAAAAGSPKAPRRHRLPARAAVLQRLLPPEVHGEQDRRRPVVRERHRRARHRCHRGRRARARLAECRPRRSPPPSPRRRRGWSAQQRCDGSFGGGMSTEGSNANSTGLVAWALGDTPASRQAATWSARAPGNHR